MYLFPMAAIQNLLRIMQCIINSKSVDAISSKPEDEEPDITPLPA
jgi:hypothetical protein